MTDRLTITDVLQAVEARGLKMTKSTLRKYIGLGLVTGETIEGRGHVLYFSPETPERLLKIADLNKKMNVPLGRIDRFISIPEKKDEQGRMVFTPQFLFIELMITLSELNIAVDQELDKAKLQKIVNRFFKKLQKENGIKLPS